MECPECGDAVDEDYKFAVRGDSEIRYFCSKECAMAWTD